MKSYLCIVLVGAALWCVGSASATVAPGTPAGGVTIDESIQAHGAGAAKSVISSVGPVPTLGRATDSTDETGTTAAGVVAMADFPAAQAVAATTVPVRMTLAEPLKAGTPGNTVCPDIGIAVNCGSGEVSPFGHATEEVNIGVCGDSCNIREIELAQGSIVLLETITGFSCPGTCGGHPFFPPGTISLSDVVLDGTGLFAGASGAFAGTVGVGGWHGVVQLSGALTLSSCAIGGGTDRSQGGSPCAN